MTGDIDGLMRDQDFPESVRSTVQSHRQLGILRNIAPLTENGRAGNHENEIAKSKRKSGAGRPKKYKNDRNNDQNTYAQKTAAYALSNIEQF